MLHEVHIFSVPPLLIRKLHLPFMQFFFVFAASTRAPLGKHELCQEEAVLPPVSPLLGFPLHPLPADHQ